jgi:hypothetical protein
MPPLANVGDGFMARVYSICSHTSLYPLSGVSVPLQFGRYDWHFPYSNRRTAAPATSQKT